MPSNKKQLAGAKLYLILDAQVLSHQRLFLVLKAAVRSGVGIVQLRDKNGSAKEILSFCRRALKVTAGKSLFIVNDRVDLALLSGADGVHLGQVDIACRDARKLMGHKAIIGVSCQSLIQARQAQAEGADYIGFGSVFKTKTKPERSPMDLKVLRRVIKEVDVPVYPIGGISRSNIDVLTGMGIHRAAVCRDILLAKDPGQVVKELTKMLNKRERNGRVRRTST